MTPPLSRLLPGIRRVTTMAVAGLTAVTAWSCSGTGGDSSGTFSGPRPKLAGSTDRPVNHLPRGEYPFDDEGNYVESWARDGDRRWAALDDASRRTRTPSRSSSSSSRTTSSRASSRAHTVSSGDTLWGISRRYGASVASIKSANGLRSDTIRPGQRLRIP